MGLPWAIFTTSLILFVVSVIAFAICAMIVEDNRGNGSSWFPRMLRNAMLIVAAIALLLFLSSFWVGAIGYGWFS